MKVRKLSHLCVIWQKGESQDGGNKETKHAKFSNVRVRIKEYEMFVSENLVCLVFLLTPF